jgi:ankyrin repeat protein
MTIWPSRKLTKHIKTIVYSIVFVGFSSAHAGSFEDYFSAIKHDDARLMQSLLARGFDANTVDEKGQSGLMLAYQQNASKVLQVLMNWPKTRVEARNPADESVLMLAALKGQLDLCKRLIELGADVNKTGWTPLHYAATGGHTAVIALLLEANAYIDAESPNETTPLMMAAHYGSDAAVKLLLEEGADPLMKNQQGLSALDFATGADRKEAAAYIKAFMLGKIAERAQAAALRAQLEAAQEAQDAQEVKEAAEAAKRPAKPGQ